MNYKIVVPGKNEITCKSEKHFENIKLHYILEEKYNNVFLAVNKIEFCVVGFDDENKKAVLHKEYKTLTAAVKKAFELKNNNFDLVMIRQEKKDFYSDLLSSSPFLYFY